MKRFGRWLAIAAGLSVVLAVVAVILVKVLVTPERVRATVLPMAEQALHRKVALSGIQVGLFSGVHLTGLTIAEPDGGEQPFVAADEVVLRYRFWPLLLGRVLVDEVRLVDPHIRLVRLADGRFNFSDLLPGKTAPEQASPAAAGRESGTAGESGIDLVVSHVTISGGEVIFRDYTLDPDAPYRLKFSDVALNVTNLNLEKGFPFELQGMLNDARLAVSGKMDLKRMGGQARVQLTDLDLTGFAPYLRHQLPGKLGTATISTDLELAGGSGQFSSSGQVDVGNLDLTLDALPKTPLRHASLKLDYDVKADLAAKSLDIGKGDLEFNGLKARVSGKVTNYASAPRLDLQLEIPALDLRQALDALPQELVAGTSGLDPAGRIDLQAHLAGPAAKPSQVLQSATLQLTGVQASLTGLRPALTGALVVTGSALTSKGLQLVSGDNRAAVDLRLADIWARPLVLTARLRAERLDLPGLPLPAAGAPERKKAQSAPAAPATEAGPLDLPLRGDFTMQIGSLLLRGLPCESFDAHARLEKNVLTVDRLDAKVAQGTFSDTARIDLGRKGYVYSTHLVARGIQLEPVLAALRPAAAKTLAGALTLDAKLAGQGTLPETFKRHLNGGGELRIDQGRVDGGPLVQGLAAVLGLEELRRLSFEQWSGNFRIEQGKVRFDSRFSGRQVRLAPQGSVGLDGSLDVTLDARLAPELTARLDKQGGVSRYLADAQGWGQVPLKVSGSLERPRFEIDARAAAQKAGRALEKKLEQKLLKKLAPGSGTDKTSDDSGKQLLEQTIRGLLGN